MKAVSQRRGIHVDAGSVESAQIAITIFDANNRRRVPAAVNMSGFSTNTAARFSETAPEGSGRRGESHFLDFDDHPAVRFSVNVEFDFIVLFGAEKRRAGGMFY